jgi:hypothetical protein
MFVSGKPFQPRLMFVSKARAYTSEVPSEVPLLGRLSAVHTNIN